jgi:type I restriction-modification system DNA methylase subunit
MAKDKNNGGANLGFEADLWRAADALRSNMDAAEYKHAIPGFIYLAEPKKQMEDGAKLGKLICQNLKEIGYGE